MNLKHLHPVKGKVWAVGVLYGNTILLELCIKLKRCVMEN